MATQLSGAREIVIDEAGNSFTSGNEQTISSEFINSDTGAETQEPNTPDGVDGGRPWGGQIKELTVATTDTAVESQLSTWRQNNTRVDVRFSIPDGAGGTTNIDYLDCSWRMLDEMPNFGEAASNKQIMATFRYYTDNVIFA